MAFAGARDNYQLAVALAESGQLHSLINELYLPSLPSWTRMAISLLDRKNRRSTRQNIALPSERVKVPWQAFGASMLNRTWPSRRHIEWQDRALGRACGEIARRGNLSALVYSYYASYAFEQMPTDLLRVIFQVHPHPEAARRILSDEAQCSPWAPDSLRNELRNHYSSRRFDRHCREALEAHFAITPSSFAKRTLIDAGISPDRVAVVPYGIDTTAFPPKPLSTKGTRALRLVYVGALVQRKGLGYLLTAMRELRREPIELLLIGRGARDDSLLGHFRDVPYRLIWNVTHREVAGEMATADILVFPSLFDSFGHVILEAMAVGLPVIATANTAGADVLEEGRTGFLGPIRNADFIIDRIQWFLTNSNAIPDMARSCQQEAALRTWPRFRSEIRQALHQFEEQWNNW